MGNLGARRVPSSIGAKRRKYWLLAATALAPFSLAISGPALAQCTPPPPTPDPVTNIATCNSGGNTYSGGINYNTDNGAGGTPIDLRLLSGVNVTIPLGSPGINA